MVADSGVTSPARLSCPISRYVNDVIDYTTELKAEKAEQDQVLKN